VWDGDTMSLQTAEAISGITNVNWLHDFKKILKKLVPEVVSIFLNFDESVADRSPITSKDHRFFRYLKNIYPAHRYSRLQPILRQLTMYKSPWELEVMKKACEITGKGFLAAMSTVKPGVHEYQIASAFLKTILDEGASGPAFDSIIAGGKSACILHYTRNSEKLRNGDLVLMDIGAEFKNYCADLSRTVPVNGTYSDDQRKLYQLVLSVFRELKDLMSPGITLAELQREAEKQVFGGLSKLNIINRKKYDSQVAKKFLMHGVVHHIGSDVHDLSDKRVPIANQMTLTLEPGIYLKDLGIGIRIESVMHMNHGRAVDLMPDLPIEIVEIEALMAEKKTQ